MKQDTKRDVQVSVAISGYPYFIFQNEPQFETDKWRQELNEITENYYNYKCGAEFNPEGSSSDYVPSTILYKQASYLINKEARFMFSQMPDIIVQSENETQEEQYQKLVNKVIEKSKLSSKLVQCAKDCFIGKRVAMMIDYSEINGIVIHCYDSLKFYYENDVNTEELSKFICFEELGAEQVGEQKRYLATKYVKVDSVVYLTQVIYNSAGNVLETLIDQQKTALDYIPAIVIINDGLLQDKRGVSEIEDLIAVESGSSRLQNADIDSLRKGMNPIRYVVDMNSRTTQNLSSSAGSFWDLKTEQNQDNINAMIGTLAPELNHVTALKETLSRQRATMFESVDMPDISQSGLLSGITSYKALKALYFPLTVRCNEKLMVWKPALKFVIKTVVDLAMIYKSKAMGLYVLDTLEEIEYDINIVENYALLEDEIEEKQSDLAEIAQKTRSRKSYIKKWRADEFSSDDEIDAELMQIAIEENMFDTMSMNTQVQTELDNRTSKQNVENNLEQQEVNEKFEEV